MEGTVHKTLTNLSLDSRQVQPDGLFAAIRGTQADGHQFIDMAIERGATVILCEQPPTHTARWPHVTWVVVDDAAEAFGRLAAAFYDFPSEKLKLVGVTGTNGKTTTVTLLYQLFQGMGFKAGLLSTVENRVDTNVVPATHTTPDAATINLLIRQMVDAGCGFAFMEVSSHSVVQKRIAGLYFAGGVFTNITHEHLDYHKTFKAYIEAKKQFFDILPPAAFALVNADDRNAKVMVQNTRARVRTMAMKKPADYKVRILEDSPEGLHLLLDGREVHTRLAGTFNAYNLLATYAVARELGFEAEQVLPVLSNVSGAPGRLQMLRDPDRGITGIVDYAHTPDALEKVLETIGRMQKGRGRIITVVGCGGDRDKSKRPLMAKVAARLSQQVILTSDNPRSEDPEAIIEDMKAGLSEKDRHVLSITDRREAIKVACTLAQPGDVILIAGKGHEKYQEIKGVRTPFDDVRELEKAMGISKT